MGRKTLCSKAPYVVLPPPVTLYRLTSLDPDSLTQQGVVGQAWNPNSQETVRRTEFKASLGYIAGRVSKLTLVRMRTHRPMHICTANSLTHKRA